MADNNSVIVEAAGSLKHHIAPGTTVHDVHTVGEAMAQLTLPDVGELMLLVNGRMAYWQTALADGDTLKLIPAISGGCH